MPSPRALLPAAAAAGVVLLAGLLYSFGHRAQYYELATAWGAAPFRTPFLDMDGVTSAIECHRLGFDVYLQNPCDVLRRLHNYSPLWLLLAVLPIAPSWDNALGLGLVLLFLIALACLPPARTWQMAAMVTLGALSSATMFALERANVDLLMFVMALLAVRLRWTGYAIALLAGMLKFYPIVLLILAVRERLRPCIVIWLVAVSVIAVWFVVDGHAILEGIGTIPANDSFDDNAFGSHDLPFGLARLAALPPAYADGIEALLLMAMLGVAMLLTPRVQLEALTDAEAAFLLAGSVLLLSCFVFAQNVAYREIFFLFVLPGLAACGRWGRCLAGLIVVLMWNGALRRIVNPLAPYSVWLLRELAWWFVMTGLAALALRLIAGSRAAKSALRPRRYEISGHVPRKGA